MSDEKFRKYIVLVIDLLKKMARRAKAEVGSQNKGSADYAKGIVMGYYSIFTLLKREAFIFCIDQKELGLSDMKPELDLLGLETNHDLDLESENWTVDVIDEEKIKRYLSDSITLLKEQAIEAKKEAEHPKKGSEDYNKGEWMAYFSLFSLLKQQAIVFSINKKELGIID